MKQKYQFLVDQSRRGLRWILLNAFILIITLQSSSQSYDWGNVAIGGGGFVSAVIADPSAQGVFYARTDVGGAYRWDEGTQSWIPLTDWVSETELGLHGIDGIAVDPNVAGRVYLLAGTTYWNDGKSMFMRSDDYGDTWEKFDITSQFKAHGNGMGRGNGERIAVDPNNSNIIFIGSRFDGMWKSTNRGSSWTQVSSYPVTTTANEAGTSIIVFDPSSAVGGVSQTIYAGVARANDNLYVSHDAGASWSLVANRPTAGGIMPQRIAVSSDGNTLYVTYGNGAGPHAQLWGGVTDYFNRGAIYKYDVPSGTWTDISPENYMLDLDKIEEGTSQVHYGAYSGISIDPTNENRILLTSINSWRGVQYWNDNGTWLDKYGDNIFLSEDGGQTWREMFRFYSTENGQFPDYDMVSTNGINWVKGSTVHWNSSVVIDPFNSDRAFVTCGNGVWGADNLSDFFTRTDSEGITTEHGKATWKFKSHGIDETVPQDLVSVPGGPLISTILDYTGFSHTDITQYVPPHNPPAGSTTGLAVAAQNPAKVVRVGVDMHYSTDTAKTWTQTTINGEKGKLALSADGNVLLHSPQGSSVMYRSTDNGSTWSTVSGINTTSSFLQPVADPINVNKFYTYDPETGAVMRSTDGGASFSQVSTVAIDGKRKLRAAPDREGDIWIALDSAGLVRSTNSGSSFSTISGIPICRAVGFGKAANGASYPAVYIWGTINGVTGIYQSIDEGATWTRVNDDDHEYGGPANGEYVVGDMNVFGRVYMSTAGRGIVYGEPASTSDYLTTSSSTLDFTSAASSQNVIVSSNVSWTVSVDQPWLSTSATSGSNDGSFSITVTANDATTNDRTGTVTLTGGGITRTIAVTQQGASDELSLSASSLSFTAADSSEIVWVGSNIDWTVSADQTWISLSNTSGSGDGFFDVLVTANTASASRNGTVTVTGGEVTRTVTVTQEGNCTPSPITPNMQVNGGSMQQIDSVTVTVGDNLTFSPEPATGGTWSWTGPNAFSATTREVTISNAQTTQAGEYIATHINAEGCESTHTFNVTVTESGNTTSAWLEAECGTVGSLWNTASDANASNGQYMTVQSGNNSASSAPGTAGQINYTFSVSESGTYKVWARVITPNANDDSFWVRMDGGSWTLWNNIPATSTWQWDDVHDSNNGGSAVSYNLSSGNHTLTIAYREDGAQLDKVVVTNSGTAPSGEGSAAGNCTVTNAPPVANAGADQTVTDSDNSGSESVTLDGSGSSDSDGTISSYVWTEGGSQIATGVNPTVSLPVGTHAVTLTVTDDDGATGTDDVTITINGGSTGNDAWLEAECGTVGSLWNTVSDANASNGQYMTVQSGNNSASSAPGTAGQITYTFSVSQSGAYKVWARVITPNANDDSFWVRMDGGSWTLWNNIPATSTWQWDDVHDSNNGGSAVSYNLSSGNHTLTIAYREDGAQLDKVVVTNSGTAPSGEGSVATNCSSGNNIVVRALGAQGDETIELRVDGTTVATWTLTTALADYTASGNGVVTVHFTNDNVGRDVQVDYVAIDGSIFQSEDQATNTGVWQDNSCGGSNSEWLNCNGYIEYASASGARTAELESLLAAPDQSRIVMYPNPSEDGQFYIDVPVVDGETRIQIFNVQGKLVHSQRSVGVDKVEVNSGLNSGIYLVRIHSESIHVSRKLVIK